MRQHELANAFNPDSDARLLRASELDGLTPFQLRVTRNEILARHGYVFEDRALAEYFEKQSWYRPDPQFRVSQLSAIEQANIETIEAFERRSAKGTKSAAPSTAAASGVAATNSVATSVDTLPAADRRTQEPPATRLVESWGRQRAARRNDRLRAYKSFESDVNGDKRNDMIGVIAIGQPGQYVQELGVFIDQGGYHQCVAVADAGNGSIWTVNRVIATSPGIITCEVNVWRDDDAACCPSKQDVVVYRFDDGELTFDRPETYRQLVYPGYR